MSSKIKDKRRIKSHLKKKNQKQKSPKSCKKIRDKKSIESKQITKIGFSVIYLRFVKIY